MPHRTLADLKSHLNENGLMKHKKEVRTHWKIFRNINVVNENGYNKIATDLWILAAVWVVVSGSNQTTHQTKALIVPYQTEM